MFNRGMYDSIIDAGIAKLEETVGKFKQLFVEQTGMEDEEFFKLLNDVEKNALQESATEMTKNLQMPEDPTNALQDTQGNSLKKDVNSLQKLINSYKDIAATILNLDSADILDTYFENELLSSTKYKAMIAGSANEAKARYRDMYIEWYLHNIGYWLTLPFKKNPKIAALNERFKHLDLEEYPENENP